MTRILYPVEQLSVNKHFTVVGFGPKRNIQIYILSNDGKWYLQKPVNFIGNFYLCRCSVGTDSTPSGASFTICVVASKDRPQSPVDKEPSNIKHKLIVYKL